MKYDFDVVCSMSKTLAPAILIAIVLVVAIFAFVPGDLVYATHPCPPPGSPIGPPQFHACTPDDDMMLVGGELIPLDTTMILVAGTQSVASWMIPVIVSGIGFAIVIARKF